MMSPVDAHGMQSCMGSMRQRSLARYQGHHDPAWYAERRLVRDEQTIASLTAQRKQLFYKRNRLNRILREYLPLSQRLAQHDILRLAYPNAIDMSRARTDCRINERKC